MIFSFHFLPISFSLSWEEKIDRQSCQFPALAQPREDAGGRINDF